MEEQKQRLEESKTALTQQLNEDSKKITIEEALVLLDKKMIETYRFVQKEVETIKQEIASIRVVLDKITVKMLDCSK